MYVYKYIYISPTFEFIVHFSLKNKIWVVEAKRENRLEMDSNFHQPRETDLLLTELCCPEMHLLRP